MERRNFYYQVFFPIDVLPVRCLNIRYIFMSAGDVNSRDLFYLKYYFFDESVRKSLREQDETPVSSALLARIVVAEAGK